MTGKDGCRKFSGLSSAESIRSQQVWLPILRVWAMLPSTMPNNYVLEDGKVSSSNNPGASCSRHDEAGAKGEDSDSGVCSTFLSTSYETGGIKNSSNSDSEERSSVRQRVPLSWINRSIANDNSVRPETNPSVASLSASCSIVEEPNESDPYSCPICLSAVAPKSKAVLKFCLHTFCIGCIHHWSTIKRFCPICKGTFVGWWYNIQSDVIYDEQDLPGTETVPPGAVSSGAPEWALTAREAWRFNWRPRHRSQRPRRPPPGPRPYFYRLQRGLLSGRPSEADWSSSPAESSPQSAAIAGSGRDYLEGIQPLYLDDSIGAIQFSPECRWRHRVYEQNLRSLRVESGQLHRPSSVKLSSERGEEAEAREQKRLEPWIQRELKVLLGDSDDSIISHVVVALWKSYRRQSHASRQSGPPSQMQRRASRQTPARGVEEETVTCEKAVGELERFLGRDAATFWHELRNFAENPFTMEAYDKAVHYVHSSELESATCVPFSLQSTDRHGILFSPSSRSSSATGVRTEVTNVDVSPQPQPATVRRLHREEKYSSQRTDKMRFRHANVQSPGGVCREERRHSRDCEDSQSGRGKGIFCSGMLRSSTCSREDQTSISGSEAESHKRRRANEERDVRGAAGSCWPQDKPDPETEGAIHTQTRQNGSLDTPLQIKLSAGLTRSREFQKPG